MKVLKFLKSVGKDMLTFLIILAVFLTTIGLIMFLLMNIPIAISEVISVIIIGAVFIIAIFIFVIEIIDYLKMKWSEID